MSKRRLAVVIMFAVFAIGATVALWPSDFAPPSRHGFGSHAVPVEVATVVRRPLAKELRTIGTVEPWMETTLAAEVAGPVEVVHVEEGDQVEQDAVLVSLGTTEAQLAVDEARADLASARADRDTAEADASRAKRLHAEGALADSDLARWTLSYNRAHAAVAAAEAALKREEKYLADAHIRAPFAGVVTRLDVEVGEWVQRGGAVLILTATDRLKVRTAVEERDLPFVHVGQAVAIEADAVPGRTFDAMVTQIIPRAEERTHTFPVLIAVPNPDELLRPGMFARAAFARKAGADVVLAPADALVATSDGYTVFIVEHAPVKKPTITKNTGGGASDTSTRVDTFVTRERAVRVGTRVGEWVEIIDGVDDGATVIVTGAEQVHDGATIKIVAGDPPARQPAKPPTLTDGT